MSFLGTNMARLGAWLVMLVLSGCVTRSTLPAAALDRLKPGHDDALIFEQPKDHDTRLEPSSRVRFQVSAGEPTQWVLAESLHANATELWWRSAGQRVHLPRHRITAMEVVTFNRWASLVFVALGLLTGAAVGAVHYDSVPTVELDPGPRTADEARSENELLFTAPAMRKDKIHFIVAHETMYGAARAPDLAMVTHVGVQLFEFFEVTAGVRLPFIDYLGKMRPPLAAASQAELVPGFSARASFIGMFDANHRVGMVLGVEVGSEAREPFFRPMWGLRLRPIGGVHLTALLGTPVFTSRGTAWGFGLDAGWHF